MHGAQLGRATLDNGEDYLTGTSQPFFGYIGISFLVIALMSGGDGRTFHHPRTTDTALPFAQTPEVETPDFTPHSEPVTAPNIMSGLLSALAASLQKMQSLTASSTPSQPLAAWITHYGERFNQRIVGCHGYGLYSSDDPTIVAVNPALYEELPCGTLLELCGPGGCLIAARKDSCPGCRPDGFDLSEAGFKSVCGDADGVCTAAVRVLTTCQVRKFGKPAHEAALLEAAEMEATGRLPCHPVP